MFDATLLGYAAGALTTAAFVPQVLRTWRTRSTTDISLAMYVVIVAGTSLWLAYGVITRDPPLIVANGVTVCLQLCIVAMKLRHG